MKARVGVAVAVFLASAGAFAQVDQGARNSLTEAAGAGCSQSWGKHACAFIQTGGVAALGVNVRGTFSATVLAEGTVGSLPSDGDTDWVQLLSTTAEGAWILDVAGYKQVRFRASAYTSGTAVVNTWSAGPTSASAVNTTATSIAKAEDALHASGDVGVMNLGVVNTIGAASTAGTTFSGTNGDYVPFAADGQGRLKIYGQYLEDAAHANGDGGNFVLAVRNDTAATAFSSLNGDYSPVAVDDRGRVFVYHDQALPAGTNAIGEVGLTYMPDEGQQLMASSISVAIASNQSAVTVTDGAGAMNTIVDSGTLTAVTAITNPVTVTDGAGALNVIVDSSALPTGAATEATLVAASAKLPAVLGQTTMAASLSVALASDQGAITVTDGTGALNTIVDSGTLTAVTSITNPVTVTDGAGALNVIVDSITAGDNNIGNVDIVTMPTVTVTDGAGAMNVIVDSGNVTASQAAGWKAPAACVVGAGAAAQAADFAVLAAVADTRLCKLQLRDTGAGTAAGLVRHGAYGANCNTGSPIGYFSLGAGAVYDVIGGSRDIAVASGVCVDMNAGTVDASWASVVEAAP